MTRPPLLLTGAPAAGKSTTARRLAAGLARAAVIDVDDLRHLVVAGHAAPWEGNEGARQQQLGVSNACLLARQFLAAGFDVVLSDLVTGYTLSRYRELLPGVRVVRLAVSLAEARRRAALRPVHLTDEEFEALHARDEAARLPVDATVEVTRLDLATQVASVRDVWDCRS